jgi:fructose-1,6-bisphosphatase/inositol monophosphatase family enzyme
MRIVSRDPSVLLDPLRELHTQIRDAVVEATEQQHLDSLSSIHREEDEDTIYAIDVVSEQRLLELFEKLSRQHSFVLIAEGLSGGKTVFPSGTHEADATWRIIVDPIDGTRGLMYQKRSGWILTGVAPNLDERTSLQDIVCAVQTEIPLIKQHLSDQLWAIRGKGASGERFQRLSLEHARLSLHPSTASTIAHGFAMIARFFPGLRDELAALDDEVVRAVLGPGSPGKAQCFEDQYLSSAGQLYELMVGHDRYVAELRPLLLPLLAQRGLPRSLCSHPYDLCTALIATEAGVIVTGPAGEPLNPPLDVHSDVAWVGYANERIRRQIEPALQAALRRRGWIT